MNYKNKKYPQLNVPVVSPELDEQENELKIRCLSRNKLLVATPEEWVRQHLLLYLTQDLNFPKSLVSVERLLTVNGLKKRWDILVYNGKGEPEILVECKRPSIAIDKSTLEQALRYQSELNCRYLILSNGLQHYLFENKKEGISPLSEFPVYK